MRTKRLSLRIERQNRVIIVLYSLFSLWYLGTSVTTSLNTSSVNPGSHPRTNLNTGWQRITRTNSLYFMSFSSSCFLFNISKWESISCVIRRGSVYIGSLSRNILFSRCSVFISSLSCNLYLSRCISCVYVTWRSVIISRCCIVFTSSWGLFVIIIFFTICVTWQAFTPDITRAFIASKIIFFCR